MFDRPVMFPPGRERLATNPLPTGIASPYHDNRNAGSRLLGSLNGGRAASQDDIHFHTSQFCRQAGKALVLTLCPAVLDNNVLTLHKPKLAQPRNQGLPPLCGTGSGVGLQ